MAHDDYVKEVCDDLGVCTEEALCYLEGFKWDFDAAMEACRNKTLPSVNVDPSSPSKPSAVEACLNKTLPSINVASSPSKLTAMEACRNKTLPSINVASSPLKPPINLKNQDPVETQNSPSRHSLEAPLLSSVSQGTSKNGEIEIITEQDSRVPMVNMPLPAQITRWSIYVKTCHEMILFLTAAALAFLPIRFMIDEQKKCGTNLGVQDYLEVVLTLLEGFNKVDPFILSALAYAGFYLLASGSFSPSTVRFFEAASIVLGFSMVFVVIYYISPITFT